MANNSGMYLRIKKCTEIDLPEYLSYEEAIEYGRQQDADNNLQYDLCIDVMYANGEIANEAGYGAPTKEAVCLPTK